MAAPIVYGVDGALNVAVWNNPDKICVTVDKKLGDDKRSRIYLSIPELRNLELLLHTILVEYTRWANQEKTKKQTWRQPNEENTIWTCTGNNG